MNTHGSSKDRKENLGWLNRDSPNLGTKQWHVTNKLNCVTKSTPATNQDMPTGERCSSPYSTQTEISSAIIDPGGQGTIAFLPSPFKFAVAHCRSPSFGISALKFWA